MIVGKFPLQEHVKFISYTGEYPNLCRGVLTLEIDGRIVTFNDSNGYEKFWESGGECSRLGSYYCGEWLINIDELPDEYKEHAYEIDKVFNENVEYGCCGGCY